MSYLNPTIPEDHRTNIAAALCSTSGRDQILEADRRSTFMPKLTKRTVEAALVKASEYFVWDDEVPGVGLQALASRRKGHIVQYRAGRQCS